jgi:hypothetical protein
VARPDAEPSFGDEIAAGEPDREEDQALAVGADRDRPEGADRLGGGEYDEELDREYDERDPDDTGPPGDGLEGATPDDEYDEYDEYDEESEYDGEYSDEDTYDELDDDESGSDDEGGEPPPARRILPPRPSFAERHPRLGELQSRFLAPAPGSVAASEEEVVNKLQRNEQLAGFAATVLLLLLTITVTIQLFDDKKATLRDFGWEFLGVGLLCTVLLGVGSLFRRRALVGFASALIGLALVNFGLALEGFLFLALGSWLVFRSLRLAKAARNGTLGQPRAARTHRDGATANPAPAAPQRGSSRRRSKSGPGTAASRALPPPSKRYTPPRQGRKVAVPPPRATRGSGRGRNSA